MAQRTFVTVLCDLPHKEKEGEVEGTETLLFGLDGTSYEVDACDVHAKGLRESFGLFIEHARRTAAARTSARRHRTTGSRDHSSAVRAWASQNGYQVSERGRIPAAVEAAYDAAH